MARNPREGERGEQQRGSQERLDTATPAQLAAAEKRLAEALKASQQQD